MPCVLSPLKNNIEMMNAWGERGDAMFSACSHVDVERFDVLLNDFIIAF